MVKGAKAFELATTVVRLTRGGGGAVIYIRHIA